MRFAGCPQPKEMSCRSRIATQGLFQQWRSDVPLISDGATNAANGPRREERPSLPNVHREADRSAPFIDTYHPQTRRTVNCGTASHRGKPAGTAVLASAKQANWRAVPAGAALCAPIGMGRSCNTGLGSIPPQLQRPALTHGGIRHSACYHTHVAHRRARISDATLRVHSIWNCRLVAVAPPFRERSPKW